MTIATTLKITTNQAPAWERKKHITFKSVTFDQSSKHMKTDNFTFTLLKLFYLANIFKITIKALLRSKSWMISVVLIRSVLG